MSYTFQSRLQAIDRRSLTPIVRCALGRPEAEVHHWQCEALTGGLGSAAAGGLGIYRFFGSVEIPGQVLPWSLVLKAKSGAAETAKQEPACEKYWKREVLAYQSGLLDDSHGNLTTPRCYGVGEYPNDEYWIWLEYIEEDTAAWSMERYALAARHLGQFSGASAIRPLPALPWLYRGLIYDWPDSQAPLMPRLHELAQHPQSWLNRASVERILRLFEERKRFQAMLERLPRCLCHHDAFRRNLRVRQTAGGAPQTVALDWEQMGIGFVGEDPARLTTMSLGCLEVTPADPAQLDKVVFGGYMEGLRDAGWRGDEAAVRFGYTAAAALIMGVGGIVRFLPRIADENWRAWAEQSFYSPVEVILERWRALHEYVLDLGDEARGLLSRLPNHIAK